jgi:hypothetical protein
MKIHSEQKLDHQIWAAKFFLCEVLNFINVLAQVTIPIFLFVCFITESLSNISAIRLKSWLP